jgi:hypothetical protein
LEEQQGVNNQQRTENQEPSTKKAMSWFLILGSWFLVYSRNNFGQLARDGAADPCAE